MEQEVNFVKLRVRVQQNATLMFGSEGKYEKMK
jgi:hypothetical protein